MFTVSRHWWSFVATRHNYIRTVLLMIFDISHKQRLLVGYLNQVIKKNHHLLKNKCFVAHTEPIYKNLN